MSAGAAHKGDFRWVAAQAQATGAAHLAGQLPCQDAVTAQAGVLPFLVVCDGRGSAQRSELGAAAGVNEFTRIVLEQAEQIGEILGPGRSRKATRARRWENFVHDGILPRLVATLASLAAEHGLRSAEFEYTISAAVIGSRQVGWLQLGDSGLVAVNGFKATLLCAPQQGRYANETYFVSTDEYARTKIASGVMPLGSIKALFAFSDGVVPRFFNLRTHLPGPVFAQVAKLLCRGKWNQHSLENLLRDPSWKSASEDDRSLAVLFRPRIQISSPACTLE